MLEEGDFFQKESLKKRNRKIIHEQQTYFPLLIRLTQTLRLMSLKLTKKQQTYFPLLIRYFQVLRLK